MATLTEDKRNASHQYRTPGLDSSWSVNGNSSAYARGYVKPVMDRWVSVLLVIAYGVTAAMHLLPLMGIPAPVKTTLSKWRANFRAAGCRSVPAGANVHGKGTGFKGRSWLQLSPFQVAWVLAMRCLKPTAYCREIAAEFGRVFGRCVSKQTVQRIGQRFGFSFKVVELHACHKWTDANVRTYARWLALQEAPINARWCINIDEVSKPGTFLHAHSPSSAPAP